MDSVLDRTLTELGVSFTRKEALATAVATGQFGHLPWTREAEEPLAVAPGTVVGDRYEVLDELGRGSFGAVFRALDQATGEQVAVKVLTRPSPSLVERMESEVDVLRRLDLPGVVGFLDEGDWAGHPHVVMQLVRGAPFPGASPGRSWATLGPRIVALCEAVARVHAAGVLHRDLKPDNILWVDDHPVLLDFGLAIDGRLVLRDAELAGSPAYLAPEQYVGDAPTVRSDLFSLGVVIYEALTGKRPFPGDGVFEVVRAMLGTDPEPLTSLADVPSEVAAVVHDLLSRTPDQRPASAVQVVQALTPTLPRLRLKGLGTEPLSREGLQVLFVGPELIHHLRSDPADQLWARTGGWPGAVRRTVASWARAGICHVDEHGRVAIERPAVDRLRAGLAVDPSRGGGLGLVLTDTSHRCWWAVQLLGSSATTAAVAAILGASEATTQDGLEALCEAGALITTPTGWTARRVPPEPRPPGLVDVVLQHLDDQDEAKLRLLLDTGHLEAAPAVALAVAQACVADGAFHRAWTAASEGLRVERRMGASDAELLLCAANIALKGFDKGWLSIVLREAERRGESEVRWLCAVAIDILSRKGVAADLDRAPLTQGALELWRLRLIAFVHQTSPLADHRAWVEGIREQAMVLDPSGHSFRNWQSRLLIRLGRPREAAELGEATLTDSVDLTHWATTILNASMTWVEAGDFERAEALLHRATERTSLLRAPALEAHLLGTKLSLAYRRKATEVPPAEFEAALAKLGSPAAFASHLVTLAACAWRRGDDAEGLAYATQAAARWRDTSDLFWSMAWSVQCLCGHEATAAEQDRAVAAIRPAVPPALRAQVLAGPALAEHPDRAALWAEIRPLLLEMDYPRGARREILSIAEVLDIMETRT